mgnify:CR=1 FL=1
MRDIVSNVFCIFFQEEDRVRGVERSRELGDMYRKLGFRLGVYLWSIALGQSFGVELWGIAFGYRFGVSLWGIALG